MSRLSAPHETAASGLWKTPPQGLPPSHGRIPPAVPCFVVRLHLVISSKAEDVDAVLTPRAHSRWTVENPTKPLPCGG